MKRTVIDMVHPTAMLQLAHEREAEILEASRTPRAPSSFPKVRERLGWSLIGLGTHLALKGREGQAWRRSTGPQRAL
jgi:hypothetical protein